LFGMPMFSYLLLRSKRAHANGQVSWKGRAYTVGAPNESAPATAQAIKPMRRTKSQKLRTDS